MKYNDASSLEERNENNLYEIHFYFEGDWWRAYEWSAYLATHYKTSEVSSLVPTKKSWSGNEDGIVLVGLKTQSFKKYFPELDVEDLISDKKEMVIKYNDILDNVNINNYKTVLSQWKNSLDFKEKEKNATSLSNKQKTNDIDYNMVLKDTNHSNVNIKEIIKAENKILEGIIMLNNIWAVIHRPYVSGCAH